MIILRTLSVQFKAVEIIEWHVVTVSSEYDHLTLIANRSVSVPRCRAFSVHQSELGLTLEMGLVHEGGALLVLSLLHLHIVGIKGSISVLDDERVLHCD